MQTTVGYIIAGKGYLEQSEETDKEEKVEAVIVEIITACIEIDVDQYWTLESIGIDLNRMMKKPTVHRPCCKSGGQVQRRMVTVEC